MKNSDLKFIIDFYNYTTKHLNFIDYNGNNSYYPLLLSGAGLSTAQIDGIIEAIAPNGTVYYGGTAFVNNDFSSPNTSSATTWIKNNIAANIALISGYYTFNYKVRIKLGIGSGSSVYPYCFDSASSNGADSSIFELKGADIHTFFDNSAGDLLLQVVSQTPSHAGTWRITGVTGSSNTYLTCAGTAGITYSADPTDIIYVIFSNSKIYNYDPSVPELNIQATSDCARSQITCQDNSNYSITDYNGITFNPTTTAKTWNVTYPNSVLTAISSSFNIFTFGAGTIYNSGANIYTGTYGIGITSLNTYYLANDTDLLGVSFCWFKLHTSIAGQKTPAFEVTCSNCLCLYYQCLINIDHRYKRAKKDGDTNTKRWLEGLELRLVYQKFLFDNAETCGYDPQDFCNEIAELAEEINCTCTQSTTSIVEIIPTISGASNGYIVPITYGAGDDGYPTDPIINQLHIFNVAGSGFSAGDVYSYDGSSWNLVMNLSTGVSPSSVTYPVLVNTCTDIPDSNTNLLQPLYTYHMPAATLANNGDILTLETTMVIEPNTNVTEISWLFGGSAICTYLGQSPTRTTVRLVTKISRITSGSQFCEGYYEIIGTPNSKIEVDFAIAASDLTAAIDITLVSRRDVTIAAGDVTSSYRRIILEQV